MSHQNTPKLEDIVSLCKRRGFIFPGSDVYGGLSGTWDYGPLGVALKRNVMQLWWKMFVTDEDNMYGIDAAILMNQKVWQASGHAIGFTDPLTDCGSCGYRVRADHLINDKDGYEKIKQQIHDSIPELFKVRDALEKGDDSTLLTQRQFGEYIVDRFGKLTTRAGHIFLTQELHVGGIYEGEDYDEKIDKKYLLRATSEDFISLFANQIYIQEVACPNCKAKQWGPIRQFNMMFKTNVGPVNDENSVSYLRPETAQGIFTNFKNVVDTFYPDMPFGLAQQGKAFRNEISPRDFVFRSREFEQMEIEYFVHPDNWEAAFTEWVAKVHAWCDALGLSNESVHELEVPEADRAHYSKRTIDFEFDFPIGREELLGLAYRTDFDLQNIQRESGKSMEYRPKDGGEPYVPHVIEPSFGLERAIMAVLTAAYTEDEVNGEKRIYLKLPEHLAPVKYAVSPLLKNKPELVAKAKEVYAQLKKQYGAVMWDDNGNIGKRYRRQDEIGTPHCVVIDFQTLEDNTVTIRDRDTTEQTRSLVTEL